MARVARTKRMVATLKSRFLAELSLDPRIVAAAEAAGVSRWLCYDWKQRDPVFAAAWDAALERSLDDLEVKILDRALDGVPRPVYQGGKLVGHEQVYDHRLAEYILTRRRPEKWGDRSLLDVNVTVHLAERLEQAAAERRKRLAAKSSEVIDV